MRHFDLPSHSMQHMAVCHLSLHKKAQNSIKFIFQIGTLYNPHGMYQRMLCIQLMYS